MKKNEMRQMPVDELKVRLRDALEELVNLKFQHSLHQLDNPLKLRILRREIARMRTLVREQELGRGQSPKVPN
jgi:large subunit ribosomal protein L29